MRMDDRLRRLYADRDAGRARDFRCRLSAGLHRSVSGRLARRPWSRQTRRARHCGSRRRAPAAAGVESRLEEGQQSGQPPGLATPDAGQAGYHLARPATTPRGAACRVLGHHRGEVARRALRRTFGTAAAGNLKLATFGHDRKIDSAASRAGGRETASRSSRCRVTRLAPAFVLALLSGRFCASRRARGMGDQARRARQHRHKRRAFCELCASARQCRSTSRRATGLAVRLAFEGKSPRRPSSFVALRSKRSKWRRLLPPCPDAPHRATGGAGVSQNLLRLRSSCPERQAKQTEPKRESPCSRSTC